MDWLIKLVKKYKRLGEKYQVVDLAIVLSVVKIYCKNSKFLVFVRMIE